MGPEGEPSSRTRRSGGDDALGRRERLEKLVRRLEKDGARAVPPESITELVELHRELAADLARRRARQEDPDTLRRLNELVVRSHGQVYRSRRPRRIDLVGFYARDVPRLARRSWRHVAASALIGAAFAVMAYHVVQDSPGVVGDVMSGMMDSEFRGEKTPGDIRDRFRSISSPVLSSMVTTNNVRVALTAAALGVTFGVGTVYVLVVNGTMVGGLAGAYSASGIGDVFWLTILPHGALELSAVIVAGAAGLLLGHALWWPGRRTRRRALTEAAGDATRLVLGLVPAFVVAGLMEGFVTPSDAMPDALKATWGAALAVAFWAWLAIGGLADGGAGDVG